MSSSLNRAMLIGNITREIELKKTQSGQSVCSFSIATNRSWKNQQGEKQEETQFHNIVAWGRVAEIIAQYLGKGSKIYVDGRLATREYETQSGEKRRVTEVVLENMLMLDSKKDSGERTTRHPDMGGIETTDPVSDDIKLEDIPF